MPRSQIALRAYPRGRGGNKLDRVKSCIPQGLSPRARGKHRYSIDGTADKGPIPAGAGETHCRVTISKRLGAYPRGRGGNEPILAFAAIDRGLSPRARGKRRQRSLSASWSGPIPAGAGETDRVINDIKTNGAYPRGRGGNTNYTGEQKAVLGLSPRARGKHNAAPSSADYSGPIPAGAGETYSPATRTQWCRAYPRGRGGNFSRFRSLSCPLGLSPRARGKLAEDSRQPRGCGPIPAGAGETVV